MAGGKIDQKRLNASIALGSAGAVVGFGLPALLSGQFGEAMIAAAIVFVGCVLNHIAIVLEERQ